MRRILFLFVFSLALLSLGPVACDGSGDAAPASDQGEAETSATDPGDAADAAEAQDPMSGRLAWDDFVDEAINAYFEAHPTFAVTQGRHEFDGQLPDWSRAGINAEIERLKKVRSDALAVDDEALTEAQRYQRDYLVARTDRDLFWLDVAGWPFKNPAFYFDWMLDSLDPSPYVTLTYAPPEQRLEAVTTYLQNIPTAVAQIRDNLETPLPRTYVDYGIASFGGMADYFENEMVQAFSSVTDQTLLDAFNQARTPAVQAMSDLAGWLEQQRETATDDFALGADLFTRMVRDTEGVDADLATLQAVGESDLARNTRALEAACAEFAPGEDIRACFARMASNKPDQGAVQAARDQLSVLKAHVVGQDLVTIPSDEEARVEEAPPYARSNFAFINIPGPYEKDQPSIYYIAPPDPSWPEDVQRDYVPGKSDLMFTSIHEVWPGHFLNFLHAKQSDWIFGRLYVGYAFAEGWAHYTEEMMWETGLGDGDPEVHIGQLSNALLRNIRYLCTIGMHTQGMTVDECRQKFVDEGFQDEGTARQQAARGTYDPAYLNYTMGKLMIRQLRDDWSAERGGREAWKAFHDEFLSYGGPPIPLVRGQMLGGEPEAVFYTEEQPDADTRAAVATGRD